jgi:hypothetical protein
VHIAQFRQDVTPPAAISDLEVTSLGRYSTALTWTWPGDDVDAGTAAAYELRYADYSITPSTFAQAELAESGTPGPGGTIRCTEVDDLDDCTTYYWAVKVTDDGGNVSYSNSPPGITKCTGALYATCGGNLLEESSAGVHELTQDVVLASPAYELALGQGQPNPSTGSVTISYTLAHETPVSIRVYDVAGRLVRTLVNETGAPGPHDVTWDSTSDEGRRVAAGVYFYRMNAGTWQSQKRVVFLER